ncbi:MAG: carboxypeptidase regulatory-like domain-containing protein [Acidobacteriota bacterium]
MNRWLSPIPFFCVVLSGVLIRSDVKAQDATGRIEGVLRDPQGALVANATVRLTHLGTSSQKVSASDRDGAFSFVLLPIGTYRLVVEAPNFARYVREPITLNVSDVLRLLIDLKIGTAQEVVQVNDDAALVETLSNALGKVTSGREMVDLPLNGRNFAQLGLLQAGAAPLTMGLAQAGGSLREGHAYSINGLRPESNNFLIDGARNINNVDTGFALKPPIDAIAEFRIITSGATAEFGESLGSNTSLVMKSGSNTVHGSVYEFFRNDVFDARNFFARDVEPLKQNQFGATAGGPLRRDRTFFFGYYEGFRNRQGITRTTTVPSDLERAGDFSQSVDATGQVRPLMNFLFGQPVPGNRIPADRIHPVARNLLEFYPRPNIGRNLFNSTQVQRNDSDQFGIRIDHKLSQRDEFFGRYLFSQSSILNPLSINGADVPGFPVGDEIQTQNLLLSNTHTVSPSLVNYIRFAFFRNRFDFDRRFNQTLPSSLGFQITPSFRQAVGPPFIQVSGLASVGNPITGPRLTRQNSYEFGESLSWIRGRHQLKMGIEYRRNHIDAEQGIASNGFFVFVPFPLSNAIANLLLGAPVVFLQAGGELARDLNSHDFAAYAQDEFKVSPGLTFNVGLRYQVNTPYTEAHGRLAGFRPGVQSQVQPHAPPGLVYPGDPGVPDGLVPAYKRGLSPRFGLSWDPAGDGKSSVRAAYGIFFESLTAGQGGVLQAPVSAPPYLQTRQVDALFLSAFGIPGPRFDDPFLGVTDPFPPGEFPYGITHLTIANNLRPPYVQNWNLSLQREFAGKYLVEARYVGTKGTRLPRFIEGNPPIFDPSQRDIDRRRIYAGCRGATGPCDFKSVGLIAGLANSTYHSMQWNLNRRFSGGLYFTVSYTLSKSLDYVSSLNETASGPNGASGETDIAQNPFDLRAEHGSSIFDARHRWVMSASWELPFLKNARGFVKTLLAGWQLNGIANLSSGTPFTVYDSVDVAQSGNAPEIQGFPANRPNLVSDPNRGPRTVDQWFDISAFQRLEPMADAGKYGNAGRNIVRAPGFHGVDLSVFKNFPIHENQSLQVRAECFNFANHANFFIPENDVGSPNFGRILQAGPPRLLQFALKYLF